MIKRTIILSFILLLNVSIYSCSNTQSSPNSAVVAQGGNIAEHVDPKKFNELIGAGEGLLLDVRTPKEFADGKIAGAENIDFYSTDFKETVEKLDKDKPVYVYCRSGRRSGIAMTMMNELGFKEVYNLFGGIGAWQSNNMPVEK